MLRAYGNGPTQRSTPLSRLASETTVSSSLQGVMQKAISDRRWLLSAVKSDNNDIPSQGGAVSSRPKPPPPPVTTEPPPVTTEPPPVTTEPPPVTTEPPPVTTEPPPVTTEPPPVTTEPPPVTTEPPPVTTEPPPVTTEPPPVTTEPPPVTTEPPLQPRSSPIMFSFSYSPGYAPASAFSTSGSVAVSTVSNGTYQYDTGNLEAGTFGFTINWDTYTVTVHIGEFYMYPAYPALPGAQGGQMSSFVVPIGSSNMLFNGDYDNSVTLTVTL